MTDNEKYTALVEKDPAYDGAFFAAVKTTGIFCRTTCTARKPKQENVCFYDTIHDALAAGYRPCKICRPMESADHIPHQDRAHVPADKRRDQLQFSFVLLIFRALYHVVAGVFVTIALERSFPCFPALDRLKHDRAGFWVARRP